MKYHLNIVIYRNIQIKRIIIENLIQLKNTFLIVYNQKNEKNNIYETKKINNNNNNKSSLLIKKIYDIKIKLSKQAHFNINKLKNILLLHIKYVLF